MEKDLRLLIMISAILRGEESIISDNKKIDCIVEMVKNKSFHLFNIYKRPAMKVFDSTSEMIISDKAVIYSAVAINIISLYQEHVQNRKFTYMKWDDIVSAQDFYGYKGAEQRIAEEHFDRVYKGLRKV